MGLALGVALLVVATGSRAGGAQSAAPRLISLNPSLTAIVLRLGAGEALVGVDD